MPPTVLVIGVGTIGEEVIKQLREKGCDVRSARRGEGAHARVDITDVDSIKGLASTFPDGVDHVVVTAGHSAFGPITKFDSKTWIEGLMNKLGCLTRLVVMLANEEVKLVRDGGSITVTSGLKARVMSPQWPGISTNCAGIDAFIKSAGMVPPRGLRLNAVATTLVTETARDAGKPTDNTVPVADVAARFVESVMGSASGEVFPCGEAGASNSFGSEVFEHLHRKNKRKADEP